MTMDHDAFLELAAGAIDFPLTSEERDGLDAHLAGCAPCRRRVIAIEADQRAVAGLPQLALSELSHRRIERRITRDRDPSFSAVRLALVAAILVLAAISAAAVGSRLIERRDDPLGDVVAPTTEVSTSPEPAVAPVSAPATPRTSAVAEPSGPFPADTIVEVVVSGLRVRTAPTVDDARSAKLEPLLGVGTRLQVIEGPVNADDYDWYHVQAIGLPHLGWVAAADHDGTPWIALPGAPSDLDPVEAELIAELRADAAVGCAARRDDLPERALAGVECRPDAGTVDRVGAYRFRDGLDAAAAYRDRLLEYGVVTGAGDCGAGSVGDHRWGGSDLDRIGCFIDETGTANVRVTCGLTYVGIVARDADMAALYRWAWQPTDIVEASPVAPGICRQG